MRKIVSLMLITVMCMSIFAACSSKQQEPEPSGETSAVPATVEPTAVNTPESKKNEFGWVMPEKTIEFSYYAGQENPDTVKKITEIIQQYVLDNFNVKINKIVLDVDMEEKLNLMLASGDYPDVITGLSEAQASKWISQGRAIDLGQYVDEYAPNVKTQLGDIYKRYVDQSGKLFVIPNEWGVLPIPDHAAHFRNDYWVELGSPAYDTPEQYFDVLKKMQAAHPKNEKGEKTYAISGYASMVDEMLPTLAGIWGLKGGYKIAEDGTNTHWANTDEGLKFTLYMNKFYREGLMDPDTFINKFDDFRAKVSSERVMGFIAPWWTGWALGHEHWRTLPGWTEDKRIIQVKVKAADVPTAYYTGKNPYSGSRTIITDKAKDPEGIMKWFNFAITDIGTRLVGWGPPNLEKSVWTLENGVGKIKEESEKAFIAGTFDWSVSDYLGMYQFSLVQGQTPMRDDGKSEYWFDQNFNDKEKWKKLMNDNLRDTIYDNTYSSIDIPGNDPLAMTNVQIKDLTETLWAKAVLSGTEVESVKNFNAMRDKLNASGLKDIEKFRTAEYQKRMVEWK